MGNECTYDERREYLVKVLSRTKRKDYENYVVNAVWQRLSDYTLKPETQRYVRRESGYALIDLYFPAVNVGVECDEGYHFSENQRVNDRLREDEIAARLSAVDGAGGYIACHVCASGTFERMERDIDAAVETIKKRKQELDPAPWNPEIPPWEEAVAKGRLAIGDGLEFRTIADACRCFGRNPKRMQRCFISLWRDGYYLWCPQLAIEMPDGTRVAAAGGWTNVLSYDGRTLYETCEGRTATPDDTLRVTFAKGKDELGRTAYRFIGVFRCIGPKPGDLATGVYTRVAEELDLAPWK